MCLQAEKILREAPIGTKIYVPIRNAPRMSFSDRFWKKVCRTGACSCSREGTSPYSCQRSPSHHLEMSAGSESFARQPGVMPTSHVAWGLTTMVCSELNVLYCSQVLPRDFFNLLREQKGDSFEDFIREHMIPFEADMDKPMLGIAPDMLAELHNKVHHGVLLNFKHDGRHHTAAPIAHWRIMIVRLTFAC